MSTDEDTEYIDLGIKKTNIDKLTYKYTIQKIIEQCLNTKGQLGYYDHVDAYVDAIMFDIKGYKFKTKVKKLIQDLNVERKKEILNYLKKYGYEAINPKYYFPFKHKLTKGYYEGLFEGLQQLVANEDLLLETGKTIPIRIKE